MVQIQNNSIRVW